MSVIKAELVKKLRDITNVGMMECKRALEKTNGDIEAAIDLLRKSGEASAMRKQSRIAKEGVVIINQDPIVNKVVMLEVNCETDFVAKNITLFKFANDVAHCILNNNVQDLQHLNNQYLNQRETVEQARLNLVAQLGENIVIRRYEVYFAEPEQIIGAYVHGSAPAKIASVICLEGGDISLAKDIAMHVAAMRPEYITFSDIPIDRYNKEKEIFTEQVKLNNKGKPEDIVQKIIEGKVNKVFKELTLLNQVFVKNSDITIEKLLATQKAKILKMIRMEVGESIV